MTIDPLSYAIRRAAKEEQLAARADNSTLPLPPPQTQPSDAESAINSFQGRGEVKSDSTTPATRPRHIVRALFRHEVSLLVTCGIYNTTHSYLEQADEEDELEFERGALIEVVESSDSGWWKGVLLTDDRIPTSKDGLFPVNYVEALVDSS